MLAKKLFILLIGLAAFQYTYANDIPTDTAKSMVYDWPEQMPEFPGGADALEQFLNDNVKYPQLAKEKGIQGKVYVQFIVEKDGSITNVKVRRGVNKLLDDEAARVIEMMPDWKPGSMRGKKVRVRHTIPIVFALNK